MGPSLAALVPGSISALIFLPGVLSPTLRSGVHFLRRKHLYKLREGLHCNEMQESVCVGLGAVSRTEHLKPFERTDLRVHSTACSAAARKTLVGNQKKERVPERLWLFGLWLNPRGGRTGPGTCFRGSRSALWPLRQHLLFAGVWRAQGQGSLAREDCGHQGNTHSC